MSPGATMERVYLELRARILAGHFAPGARLDPARLAAELAASTTPVRDALHRLCGERLIDSRLQEGFRQPLLTETELRDLYSWSQALIGLALLRPQLDLPRDTFGEAGEGDYPLRIARLLRAAAALSASRELRLAMANAVDRCQVLRQAELHCDPEVSGAVSAMEGHLCAARWRDLRRDFAAFHRRRIACVEAVAARLRNGE